MTPRVFFAPLAVFCCLVGTLPCRAGVPTDELLPNTTKGYLSVAKMAEFREKWSASQLGQLIDDPVMQPFVEDLKEQLRSKLGNSGDRLGIELSDVEALCDGEYCIAMVQPEGDKKQHALVTVLDVTGKQAQVADWQARLRKKMTAEGAKRTTSTVAGIELVRYSRANRKQRERGEHLIHFVHDDQLVSTDHEQLAELLAKRLPAGAERADGLGNVVAYHESMQRLAVEENGLAPQVRWFVEPFGYAEVSRAASGGKKKRGTDMLKVLANQGFKAVQGIGGHVSFSTGNEEILHRAMVYAPRDRQAEQDDKYKLAARILNFPNGERVEPQAWVPPTVATWLTLHAKIQDSFEHVATLVDEIAGEPGVFEEVIKSIALDRSGPQVNLRNDLVKWADGTITVISDCRVPITTKSERMAVAFGTTNPAAVAKAIEKIMKAEPHAALHRIGAHDVWEIVNEEESVTVEAIKIEGVEFTSTDDDDKAKKKKADDDGEKHAIPNSAVTVVHGHLIWATHLDLIKEILPRELGAGGGALDQTNDFALVDLALKRLGVDKESFRAFARTDDAYHATYELLRQGKMPESETMLARVLNRLMGPEDEDQLRTQEIDGSKMPPFEQVRKYLGPSGMSVHSEDNGWYIVGCLLKKDS